MSLDNSLEFNFSEVINMIETRRNNAYKKVNEELISLYWDFGKYISEKVNDIQMLSKAKKDDPFDMYKEDKTFEEPIDDGTLPF